MTSRKRGTPGSPFSGNETPDEESLLRPRRPDSTPQKKTPSASLAKVLLHKICLISVGDNTESREGFIGLLQDIVGGIVLGTLGMSVLLLLDYANIINLETARVFRKTASYIVFDTPDVLESMKEESDKKIISMDIYNAMQKELSDSQATIKEERNIIGARTMKAASLQRQLDSLREEYKKFFRQAGLGDFCPNCPWGMGMTCQGRVNYMLEHYSDSATPIECISKLVEQGQKKNGRCLNNPNLPKQW